MNQPRVIKWVALVAGIILGPWFALMLLLPVVIDSEAVKSRARAFIADKTEGRALFEKIDVFWFPRPGVVIRDASVSFGKQFQGQIQYLRLYPSIRQLLTGNLTFSRVTAEDVLWLVRLPARDEQPFNLDELDGKLRAAVKTLALSFPGTNLQLRRGVVDIAIASEPSLRISDIDVNLGVTADRMDFAISARAPFAERIRCAGVVAASDLASEARLSLENLALRQLLDIYSPGSVGWINDGTATLNLGLKANGIKSFSAEVIGSLPSLTLARGSRRAIVAAKDFKVNVTGDEKVLQVTIENIALVSPLLKVAGEFRVDRHSSSFSVNLTGRELDAEMIRKSALLLAGDITDVQDVFRYVQGGVIAEIHFESGDQFFARALASERALVKANFRSVKIFVPGPDLELENVGGSVLISAGVLECKKCSATLGKVTGRDGTLRVGLASVNRRFHLDIMVEADARELHSLVLARVKDQALRQQIARIREIEGSVSGRLVLGESLDAFSVKVTAVPAALSASYESVPYPVALRGGRLSYADGVIEAENLVGTMGRSSFAGLSGSVAADTTDRFNIKSGSLHLDLEQTELLLRKVEKFRAKLGTGSSARGKINFASISFGGHLDDPDQWNFRGEGKVEGILVTHAALPAAVSIAQGSFAITPEKLTFAGAEVEMLDGSMTGDGAVENWRKTSLRVESTASGSIGAQTLEWIRRQTEIPADYTLRSPLEFSSGHIAWRDDGDFSFKGNLTVAHGPQLVIDMARSRRNLSINNLSIEDGGQSARSTFMMDDDKWGFAFDGTLNKQMLEKIFLTAPRPLELLHGDFTANASRKSPYQLATRGTLSAKDFPAAWKGEAAVIEQIVIQGDDAGLIIRSAELTWRKSHVSVSGKIMALKDAVSVDVDFSADRLVWDELNGVLGSSNRQGNKGDVGFQLPRVDGVIRLKAGSFAISNLVSNPLQVTARFTPNGTSGEVENSSVCGIRTTGQFAVRKNDEIEFDMKILMQNGDLESTTRCLSSEKSDITGTYSLNGRLTARGNRDQLAQNLSGGFDFASRNGRFIRSAGVDATFDYLNHTGDFNVAFPDLNNEAFPYQLISVKGTLEGRRIFAKEIVVEASPYAITAQGNVDLEQRTVDAKGLITVLLPAAKVFKSIPLVGSIVGSSMVGIPVEVAGALDQPRVSYLSAAALGTEILNIPMRILNVPLGTRQIFTPREPGADKK